MTAGPSRDIFAAIACRAAQAVEAESGAPPSAAALLRAFDASATATPALDLYQRLRDAEHMCRACVPALAARLQRLGRIVERAERRRSR